MYDDIYMFIVHNIILLYITLLQHFCYSLQVLTPVIDLKSKQKEDEEPNSPKHQEKTLTASLSVCDFDWNVANEYDPMWPNDYEKVAKGKTFLFNMVSDYMVHVHLQLRKLMSVAVF